MPGFGWSQCLVLVTDRKTYSQEESSRFLTGYVKFVDERGRRPSGGKESEARNWVNGNAWNNAFE